MTGGAPGRGSALRRVIDAEAVARAAAEEVTAAAARATAASGRFTLALAGGSTPRRLYQLLSDPRQPYRDRLRWDAVHLFFGDERHVPPDHPQSNFRMVEEALLSRVKPGSVHRVEGELPDPEIAALRYEAELACFFRQNPVTDRPPRLDLVLLGLGADGHTASLFPGSPALDERQRWVVAPYVEPLGTHRITLTFPVLDRAARVLFLVSGPEKATALARVLAPRSRAGALPAARVRPEEGEVVWIVDAAAAPDLPSGAAES